MKHRVQFLIPVILLTLFITCERPEDALIEVEPAVVDVDGNGYSSVIIGTQEWLVENLRVTHYRNGDPIPVNLIGSGWGSLVTGAYAVYDDDASNVDDYGLLYNWYALEDDRKLAPEGWHVASDEEWKELEQYLGMSPDHVDSIGMKRGTNEGGQLKEAGIYHWDTPNVEASNSSGFTALPGGFRGGSEYSYEGTYAAYWSTTAYNTEAGIYRNLSSDYSGITRLWWRKSAGLSVRCIKGEANSSPTASFSHDQDFGTISTVFTFDASTSNDMEDHDSDLQVRWDWENDGVWDTDYSSIKTSTHQFTSVGNYKIALEVMDKGGLTDVIQKSINIGSDSVTDIDGNSYPTIIIGDQEWMMENLSVTKYQDGTPIPKIVDSLDWSTTTTGAHCAYANNEDNVSEYGRLYNWYAVTHANKIAPAGWHVPSYEEWIELADYLGGSGVAGGKLKEIGVVHWNDPNVGATNESGFTALAGGKRHSPAGGFHQMGTNAYFWSATVGSGNSAWIRSLFHGGDGLSGESSSYWNHGFSLRCVKD